MAVKQIVRSREDVISFGEYSRMDNDHAKKFDWIIRFDPNYFLDLVKNGDILAAKNLVVDALRFCWENFDSQDGIY